MRENERLKSDTRTSRRTQGIGSQNIGTSFALNVSRNLGGGRRSPIGSSRMNSIKNKNNDYNDNSLIINSSMD